MSFRLSEHVFLGQVALACHSNTIVSKDCGSRFCGLPAVTHPWRALLAKEDTAAESGTWPMERTARNVRLLRPHPGRSFILSKLPVQAPAGSYHIVRIPRCEFKPLAVWFGMLIGKLDKLGGDESFR